MANETNKNLIEEFKERSNNANKKNERGIVNDKTGSSIVLDKDGNITIAASKTVQYKMKYSEGQATELSFQSNTITNRKNLQTDEIIINKHKLNPQLWELTDMKRLFGDPTSAIGDLTMCATVLVKTWEPTLEKWVLIRRPIRTQLFSNKLPLVDAPDDMNLKDSTNISDDIETMRKLDKINNGW